MAIGVVYGYHIPRIRIDARIESGECHYLPIWHLLMSLETMTEGMAGALVRFVKPKSGHFA